MDKLKREGQSRSEKDRNTICELQLEISRLKSFLDEKETKYENAQFNLNEQLQREKEAKFDLVQATLSLKSFANPAKYFIFETQGIPIGGSAQ